MRLDRLITLGAVKPVGRALGRFPCFDSARPEVNRTLPVLMYHSISDDPEPAFSPYYKVCTSPVRFGEHIQWLKEGGWKGVTLSDGLDWLAGKKSIEGSPVAITFDDGFRDFHTAAFPALKKQEFAATMYLPTGYISDQRKEFKNRECLTWSEVLELQQAGMEFGSHTVNHPVLVNLPWPEIERELADSKTVLERRLDRAVRSFAYPFAFPQEKREFTADLAEKLSQLGYENCVTTIIGRAKSGDDPFAVKRLPANSADDRSLLVAKAAGAYDWLSIPQALRRRMKGRHRKNSLQAGSPPTDRLALRTKS